MADLSAINIAVLDNGEATISLNGNIGPEQAAELRNAVLELQDDEALSCITADCSNVTSLEVSAMQILVVGLTDPGINLSIVLGTETSPAQEAIASAGLTDFFREADAVVPKITAE